MKRSLWALVVAVPLVVLLASGFGHDPNAVHSPIVGHAAPSFALRAFNGTRVSTAALRGEPTIVNFWASWCVSCKQEHQALLEAWRQYSHKVAFVGIDYQDHLSDARSFLRANGGGWAQLQDPGGRVAIDFGVYGVPETYFVNRHGVVVYKSTGPVTPSVLKAQIQRILT